ncbi:hypothetical protein Trydic_g11392 [Trypoxylus dichotomus]
MNVAAAAKGSSKAMGLAEEIVYSHRTQQEAQKSPPKKKPKREGSQKNTRKLTYDTLIRRKVQRLTVTSVNMDNNIPNFKRTTLYNLLVDIGFVFEKFGIKVL